MEQVTNLYSKNKMIKNFINECSNALAVIYFEIKIARILLIILKETWNMVCIRQ